MSETFALIGDRPAIVFGIALITVVPTRLLTLALANQGISPADLTRSPVAFGLATLAQIVLALVMGVFGGGALTMAALGRREGRPSDLVGTLVPAIFRLSIIAPVGLIYTMGFLGGMALLLVPGLIVAATWPVLGPVIVAERTGIIATFRRSQELTRNTRWRIFLLMMIVGIGVSLFHWLLGRVGLFLFDSASPDPAYAVEPSAFLFETLILMLTNGFSLAKGCTLYIALIERHGDGPIIDRLAHIFA